MTIFLTTIADFLFLTWFFWVLSPVAVIGSYWAVRRSEDDDFPFIPQFLCGIVVLAVAWRYPVVSQFFTEWTNWLYALLAYVITGWLIATIKWIIVLGSFRIGPAKEALTKIQIERTKDIEDRRPLRTINGYASDYYVLRDCKVTSNDTGVISATPDWHKYPVAQWWVYWPFYATSVILEPLKTLIIKIADLLASYWDEIASYFVVKSETNEPKD